MWSLYCKSIIQEIATLALKLYSSLNVMASLQLLEYHFKNKQTNLTNIKELWSNFYSQNVPHLRLGKMPASVLEVYNLIWPAQTNFFFFTAAINHYHKTTKVLMVYFYTHPRFPVQWNYHRNDGKKKWWTRSSKHIAYRKHKKHLSKKYLIPE